MRLLLSMLCIVIYLNGALLVDMENNQNLEPKDEDVLQNGSTKNKTRMYFHSTLLIKEVQKVNRYLKKDKKTKLIIKSKRSKIQKRTKSLLKIERGTTK